MVEVVGQHALEAWQHVEQADLSALAQLKICIAPPTMQPTEHLPGDAKHHLVQQLVEVQEVVLELGQVLRVGPEGVRPGAIAPPHHGPRWAPHAQQECRPVGEAQPSRAFPARLMKMMPLMLTSGELVGEA